MFVAKAVWLSGYSGRHRTQRFWIQNPHMLPPLVSQGGVVVPFKPELGWQASRTELNLNRRLTAGSFFFEPAVNRQIFKPKPGTGGHCPASGFHFNR